MAIGCLLLLGSAGGGSRTLMGVSPPALGPVRLPGFATPARGAAARSGWVAARLRFAHCAALGSERSAREVGDQLRRRGVESNDVEHPGIGDRSLNRR
jgi:hypothetical protein